MAVSLTSAIGAYRQAAASGAQPGMEARNAAPGQSFKDMMTDVADSMIKAGTDSEKLTAQAMVGKADLNEVVMAVANADLALQTVVAVRDKVIQAYQDILRMPI
jgi:flagellar hook-basal body complex protein FliE